MPAVWSPLRTVAEISLQGWRVELDPSKPTTSLSLNCPNGTSWQALTIEPLPGHSLYAEEIYVRQQDLIARFGQMGMDEYSFQIDWRLTTPPDGFDVGIEVWISVQTNLLNVFPKIQVSSRGVCKWTGIQHHQLVNAIDKDDDSTEDWANVNGNSIAALTTSVQGCSGLWLIDPRDLQQVHWKSDLSRLNQSAVLFDEFLEKGVIRRARMQLLASQHPLALPDVQRAYQQLIGRELPLTA